MKKRTKILLIIGVAVVFIVIAAGIVVTWLEDYTVKMNPESNIPEPAGELLSVLPDSTGWPSWKGVNHNNHSAFTNIITDWSNGLEMLWKVDYLCKGDESVTWSCPAISGNHLVVPGRRDSNDVIFCLKPQSGELLWYYLFHAPPGNAAYGEGPRATPTIDGDRVYVLSRGGLLQCLDLKDGSVIWKRDFLDMGAEIPKWGYAGSPVVFGNTLIVQVGGDALVFGLDKMTGETVWQSGPAPASYSTPVVIQYNNEPLLLVQGGQAFFALDPTTGIIFWETPWEVQNNINICTPVYSPQQKIAIISSWYNMGTQAVKINREKPVILWHTGALNAHQTDPIIIGDYVYGFSGMSAHNRDEFKCLDILTGEEKWASPELGTGQFIYIEPYFLSIDIKGSVFLSHASPEEFKVVTSVNNLIDTDNARFWTKPVTAQGNLYLRYANQLYCYRLVKPSVL
ncbi:PQQ-like beta-propeller repeat protein [candidate division KSB1 bacterium]|nr:PQQ-like beta-propeller repeat protein [candidate division KSB1 bacterium]